ncbi:MAG: CBS domain-containing protein [Anaerolineales bacterium]|nr:CBS domain-containing protein [Anaerolineales bacterium]
MRIILTHEQADFDAVASLLGAYLLNDAAIPLLPRKMNRNVKAFITLYGVDMPFVDPRDIAAEPIESIILVDTQSLISLKGAHPSTPVHVIDHHPLREDLPKDWSVTISGTGANTTIFIETLRERELALSTVQATLLLLGIYEDTGSLTYTRTTSRDLQAASYLLEQGASLSIAGNFLNHPLSREQQAFYDQLRENAAYFPVFGHTVVIAHGDAGDMDEELSTVVHKLREVLDPDALFVLVKTRGGVQMIARSTSENIDVAEIASRFGGGGHDRAAAGLIKNKPLEQVRRELVELLPTAIRPAIMVAQIMSPDPHVMAPDTPVEVASQQMLRYGYEGFPIVAQGKLQGLLTRRAVDRALAHKLDLTAASLMDAGNHTVKPDDSIEHLQRVMTETGWGQIPVVRPESGEIIGIVTRTDLLKTLTPQRKMSTRQNLAERLERVLPPARVALLRAVAEMARENQAALYIVGGFVRDLLLETLSTDFDLVVEGDAISLAHDLSRRFGGRVTSHRRFGTAKWHIKKIKSVLMEGLKGYRVERRNLPQEWASDQLPDTLDLVTARTEFYNYPTALPLVERGSIKLDLHRRDFTINTLALRLDGCHYGELHDYWGGLNDLHNGLVRVLHSLSFVDDPTRILRAVRFEQRFAFRIEARTLALILEALPLLERVSGDRIRHELNSILSEALVVEMLSRLHELNLLHAIHPELTWDAWLREKIQALVSAEIEAGWDITGLDPGTLRQDLIYSLLLLRLPRESAQRLMERLKLSAQLREVIDAAIRLWNRTAELEGATPSQVAELLNGISILSVYAVYLGVDDQGVRERLRSYAVEWRRITPFIDGNRLRAMGVPPGPIYKEILQKLRAARLNGEITQESQELALLERLLEEASTSR